MKNYSLCKNKEPEESSGRQNHREMNVHVTIACTRLLGVGTSIKEKQAQRYSHVNAHTASPVSTIMYFSHTLTC